MGPSPHLQVLRIRDEIVFYVSINFDFLSSHFAEMSYILTRLSYFLRFSLYGETIFFHPFLNSYFLFSCYLPGWDLQIILENK